MTLNNPLSECGLLRWLSVVVREASASAEAKTQPVFSDRVSSNREVNSLQLLRSALFSLLLLPVGSRVSQDSTLYR
jgi:hypothetical protein